MSFDSVQAAIEYANSHSTPSMICEEWDWVWSNDCCDNFSVILVDA